MTEVTDKLTAAELREALELVLTELDDMGMPPAPERDQMPQALAWAERHGRLTASLAGVLNQQGDRVPRISLDHLRQRVQQHPRQAGGADHQQAPAPAPEPLWVGGLGADHAAECEQERGWQR